MSGPHPGPLRNVPAVARAAAAALLTVFVLQASWAARRDSVTIDEFVHLPLGLHNLYTGDFRVDPINPPLSRMIAAAPLLLDPPSFAPDPAAGHWGMGYDLMKRNVERYQEIFYSARMMIVAVGCLLGLVVFVWATSLYGWQAGLVALALFCFSPSMLAHTHLVTLDLCGAFGFAATAWAVWALLDRPSRVRASIVGATVGVATLLKLSGFVLGAVVVTGVVIRAIRESRHGPSPATWFGMLVIAGLTALVVLNVGYGFEGTFASLADATLDERGRLAALVAAVPWLRLPVPLPLVNGIDMVLNVGKQADPSYFLAGELSADGWWYYHLAAFALKTPIPLLLACAGAMLAWAAGRGPGRREYCLYVPVLIVFASNSLFNSLQIGVRHVLPVYPLLFVGVSPWVARGLTWAAAGMRMRRASRVRAVAAGVTVVGLLWYVAGTLWVGPRYLQYFNEAAGGAAGGHQMLVDSNIDWGQDLIRLSEYMERESIDFVNLAYFGRVHPSVYGIRFVPLERGRSHGKTVVSASFLMGRPYFWYDGDRMRWMKSGTYSWLQELEPVDRVGSMFVYDLP